MQYYICCDRCGASLDPGERCDCESEEKQKEEKWKKLTRINAVGQMTFRFDNNELERCNYG